MTVRGRLRNYGGATGAAARWLQKADPDYGLRDAWERLPLDTLEHFTRAAKAWLGDRSELRTSTIDKANYAELFRWFRELKELPPLDEDPQQPADLGTSGGLGDREAAIEQAVTQAEEGYDAAALKPRMVKIPGLGRSVQVREEPPAPKKINSRAHMMLDGFPAGRYAVEIDGVTHCLWFKYNAKTCMEETRYRKDGKWVSTMWFNELRAAIKAIKEDPFAAAVRFGRETGHCSSCGRKLTRDSSLAVGQGPDCEAQELHRALLKELFG